jgi:hypothetical protein
MVNLGLETPPSAPETCETALKALLYSFDSTISYTHHEGGDFTVEFERTGIIWSESSVGLHIPQCL